MQPVQFYKCLADTTRLRCAMLIAEEEELCVCELMAALNEIQPKISRHLALLRKCRILTDRRQGQWVYYRINPELPAWCVAVLKQTLQGEPTFVASNQIRLAEMDERPNRADLCI